MDNAIPQPFDNTRKTWDEEFDVPIEEAVSFIIHNYYIYYLLLFIIIFIIFINKKYIYYLLYLRKMNKIK